MKKEHMEVKQINAYKTSDGTLFECDIKANKHQVDLLGKELDGLLKIFNLNITRSESFKSLTSILDGDLKQLKEQIKLINDILTF